MNWQEKGFKRGGKMVRKTVFEYEKCRLHRSLGSTGEHPSFRKCAHGELALLQPGLASGVASGGSSKGTLCHAINYQLLQCFLATVKKIFENL